MDLTRRNLISKGLGFGAGVGASVAIMPSVGLSQKVQKPDVHCSGISVTEFGVKINSDKDQSVNLQKAIDAVGNSNLMYSPALVFPSGYYYFSKTLILNNKNTPIQLIGTEGSTVLNFTGDMDMIKTKSHSHSIIFDGLIFNGEFSQSGKRKGKSSFINVSSKNLHIRNCYFHKWLGRAIKVKRVEQGCINLCEFKYLSDAGIECEDCLNIDIMNNRISHCGLGIKIFTTKLLRSKTKNKLLVSGGINITNNRISDIKGSKKNTGCGINAKNVKDIIIGGNTIIRSRSCAIKAYQVSGLQIINNRCNQVANTAIDIKGHSENIIINSNIIDTATGGIIVSEFACINANVIRNIKGKKRKYGIGIQIGWRDKQRDVSCTNNVIGKTDIGIAASGDFKAGYVFIAHNYISHSKKGAIHAMKNNKIYGHDLTQGSTEIFPSLTVLNNLSV